MSIGVVMSIVCIFLVTFFSFAIYFKVKENEVSNSRNCIILGYGLMVFFLGFIPLLGAGEELLELDNITEDRLMEYCDFDDEGLKTLRKESFEGKIAASVIKFSE